MQKNGNTQQMQKNKKNEQNEIEPINVAWTDVTDW